MHDNRAFKIGVGGLVDGSGWTAKLPNITKPEKCGGSGDSSSKAVVASNMRTLAGASEYERAMLAAFIGQGAGNKPENKF